MKTTKTVCSVCGKAIHYSDGSKCFKCRQIRKQKVNRFLINAGKVIGVVLVVAGTAFLIKRNNHNGNRLITVSFSKKWFEKHSLEEIEAVRQAIIEDYENKDFDLEYRGQLGEILRMFNEEISLKKYGKERGFPAPRENGWYLPNDD